MQKEVLLAMSDVALRTQAHTWHASYMQGTQVLAAQTCPTLRDHCMHEEVLSARSDVALHTQARPWHVDGAAGQGHGPVPQRHEHCHD